jgi:hypothetical protein
MFATNGTMPTASYLKDLNPPIHNNTITMPGGKMNSGILKTGGVRKKGFSSWF